MLCISLLYISYFLRWTQMLWFCKCLRSWIGIKSLIWELSLNCVWCKLPCESQSVLSPKKKKKEEETVSSSLCQIKQFLSYLQWKYFCTFCLKKRKKLQQRHNWDLTVYFCSNCFRWNSWFVCLRWYRKSLISTSCLDHSNKVTGLVLFLATYFLFTTIKTRVIRKHLLEFVASHQEY